MPHEIKDYTILNAESRWELERMVKKYITKGWAPSGGVACDSDSPLRWSQAMVKFEEKLRPHPM